MAYTFWIVALLLCELFESVWQQAPTMGKIVEKIWHYYQKSIFLLFLMHPSFWLVLYFYVEHGFKGAILSLIIVMKASDIAFKLWIIQKLNRHQISLEFRTMLAMPIPSWIPWTNIVLYPVLLTLAIG